jgi:hypothetical protein
MAIDYRSVLRKNPPDPSRPGESGSFRMTMTSNCSETKKEFISTDISKLRMRFRRGKELLANIKAMTFAREGMAADKNGTPARKPPEG